MLWGRKQGRNTRPPGTTSVSTSSTASSGTGPEMGEGAQVPCQGRDRRDGIVFAKPLTYMNLSGNAVSRLMRPNRLSPDRILVVYDDTPLSPGALRFRPGGSAGGHNGIKSIIEYLGTEAFPRSGSGWGPPPPGSIWRDHVLGPFSPEKRVRNGKVLEIAAEGVNVRSPTAWTRP